MLDVVYTSTDCVEIRCLYYALPTEAWRIQEANIIQEAMISGCRPATEEDDIRMGQLLGYSEDEIETFITHTRPYRKGNSSS